MSKDQIVAKAILATVGISSGLNAILSLWSYFVPGAWLLIVISASATVVFIAISLVLIFYNDRLACYFAGNEGDVLSHEDQVYWLSRSLTTAVFLCGLMMLSASSNAIMGIIKFPFILRHVITEFVNGDFPFLLKVPSYKWAITILDYLRVPVAIYLLFGAPHYIRHQLKRIPAYNRTKESI